MRLDYENQVYKAKLVCFSCRKMFRNHAWIGKVNKCPDCGEPTHDMGKWFKVPRRNNIKQWKKIEKLYRNGVHFHGYGRPGYRPTHLGQVDEFLENRRKQKLQRDPKRRFLNQFDD